MDLEQIKALDAANYLGVFGERLPACFVRGEGCTLYDQEGKAYTDLFAGIAVNALGYGHPAVTDALIAQARSGILHTSNLYYIQPQAELAALLCEHTFASRVFFGNSGAEANEGALKLARKYFYAQGSSRCKVISAGHSFHGRTLATVAATGHAHYQAPFLPMLPQVMTQVPFNNLDALCAAVDADTCAILLEPIQGEGGVHPADVDYLRGVRQLCDETGTLLIFDEVQTGVCRTGSLYCCEQYGVEPDLMTSAKGLGCGVPIGAVLASARVADAIAIGDHGSTFGGNPLACAVSLSAMRYMLSHDLSAAAREKGAHLMAALRAIDSPAIVEVRGMGLLVGVELTAQVPAAKVMRALLARGFVAGTAAGNVLRLAPPLIIETAQLDAFAQALTDVLAEIA